MDFCSIPPGYTNITQTEPPINAWYLLIIYGNYTPPVRAYYSYGGTAFPRSFYVDNNPALSIPISMILYYKPD